MQSDWLDFGSVQSVDMPPSAYWLSYSLDAPLNQRPDESNVPSNGRVQALSSVGVSLFVSVLISISLSMVLKQ